jgi:1-acyl-sn-glycerol-3-phosphate acyltransferase
VRGEARAEAVVVKTEHGKVSHWMDPAAKSGLGLHPEDFDAEYTRGVIERMKVLFGEKHKYFRVSVQGWENVPPSPVLVVSNHSGGTSIPDAWGLGFAWHTHFAMKRPLHVLAHELVFSIHSVGRMFARAGVLRARPDLGQRVLKEWRRDLLVMPGGDVDVWRPYSERYKVKFAGRTGYARLALKTGVPIVPLANAGAHETLRVLTDGAAVARWLKFPKLFRASIFPVSLTIPWGLTIGPWPHLPPPTRLRYRIGRAILPDGGFCEPGEEPSRERVAAYDARVRRAMQDLLDQLRDDDRGTTAPLAAE